MCDSANEGDGLELTITALTKSILQYMQHTLGALCES